MEPQPPEYLSLEDHYAACHPRGRFTFDQTVAMIDEAIAYCRDNGVRGLLVDVTGVTGFLPPSTAERFAFASRWAATANGKVVVSIIAPPEMVDPDKIGVMVATNRGLRSDVFTAESEAIAWLLDACQKRVR